MNGRCETDPLDRAVDVCDRCYGEFCDRHLLRPKGRKHPLCNDCALASSGVRGTNKTEPRGSRKSAKARRAELKAADHISDEVFRYFDDDETADAGGAETATHESNSTESDHTGSNSTDSNSTELDKTELDRTESDTPVDERDISPATDTGSSAVSSGGAAEPPPPSGPPIEQDDGVESAAERLAALDDAGKPVATRDDTDLVEPADGPEPVEPAETVAIDPPPSHVSADRSVEEELTVSEPVDPPEAFERRTRSEARRGEPSIESEQRREPGSLPLPNRRSKSAAPGRRATDLPTAAPVDDRRAPTPPPAPAPPALHRPSTAPMLSDLEPRQAPAQPGVIEKTPPPASPVENPNPIEGSVPPPRTTRAAVSDRAVSDRAGSGKAVSRKAGEVPPILRTEQNPGIEAPVASDDSDRADIDDNGDWIPPILRGMAPDATEAKADLPQRRRTSES